MPLRNRELHARNDDDAGLRSGRIDLIRLLVAWRKRRVESQAVLSLGLVLHMFVVFINCLGFLCCHLVV